MKRWNVIAMLTCILVLAFTISAFADSVTVHNDTKETLVLATKTDGSIKTSKIKPGSSISFGLGPDEVLTVTVKSKDGKKLCQGKFSGMDTHAHIRKSGSSYTITK